VPEECTPVNTLAWPLLAAASRRLHYGVRRRDRANDWPLGAVAGLLALLAAPDAREAGATGRKDLRAAAASSWLVPIYVPSRGGAVLFQFEIWPFTAQKMRSALMRPSPESRDSPGLPGGESRDG
jgi:hypothetical protein